MGEFGRVIGKSIVIREKLLINKGEKTARLYEGGNPSPELARNSDPQSLELSGLRDKIRMPGSPGEVLRTCSLSITKEKTMVTS